MWTIEGVGFLRFDFRQPAPSERTRRSGTGRTSPVREILLENAQMRLARGCWRGCAVRTRHSQHPEDRHCFNVFGRRVDDRRGCEQLASVQGRWRTHRPWTSLVTYIQRWIVCLRSWILDRDLSYLYLPVGGGGGGGGVRRSAGDNPTYRCRRNCFSARINLKQ